MSNNPELPLFESVPHSEPSLETVPVAVLRVEPPIQQASTSLEVLAPTPVTTLAVPDVKEVATPKEEGQEVLLLTIESARLRKDPKSDEQLVAFARMVSGQ